MLACGFLPDVLREALAGEEERAGAAIRYVVEPEPLGTAGAIRFAADRARRRPRRPLPRAQRRRPHRPRPDRAAARPRAVAARWRRSALAPVEDSAAYGLVSTGPEGEVTEFAEKTGEHGPGRDQRRHLRPRALGPGPDPAGTRSLDRARCLPATDRRRPARAAARRLLDGHRDAGALPAGELGHPRGRGSGPGSSRRSPGLHRRRLGAEVADDAVVGPRAVVSAGCRVAAGAEVRESVLLDGSTVGERARVSGSILAPGAEVGAGADRRGRGRRPAREGRELRDDARGRTGDPRAPPRRALAGRVGPARARRRGRACSSAAWAARRSAAISPPPCSASDCGARC